MPEPVLQVEHLKKYFPVNKGVVFSKTVATVKAVDDVSFTINPGETYGLVGESGCGKTTTSLLVLNLYTPTAGTIRVDGRDISTLKGSDRALYRKSVQAMFQDPYSSLSPRQLVRDIVGEPLLVNTNMSKAERLERVKEVVSQVGLPLGSLQLYPHEFSGGQRQRIALARALSLSPKLIVLDEPVSGLDVSIMAQVLNLLKSLQQRLGVAYLFIAHNLGNVRFMSDWVGVMYLGRLVESAQSEELFKNPQHPYTRALLSAALPSHPDVQQQEMTLSGEVPSPLNMPPGCRFHTRCPFVMQVCSEQEPGPTAVNSAHTVACHLSTM